MMRCEHRSAENPNGYVVQSTGDGIFAIFGAPVAHADHPQRALYAGMRMQEEVNRYSAQLREAGNLPIEARVGVNTGEVVVRSIATDDGHAEYTPIGHTTNLASRLQRSAGRGLTKFVGREREMESTAHAAEQSKARRGQIVAAMADAGTGNSRLFFEFKDKNQSGRMVLETFSVSHGKASAYFPVIDLLPNYFKIEGEDDQRTRRAKVTGNVLTLDRSLEDTLPHFYGLLGIVEGDDPLAQMDALGRKRRTLDAIKRILLRESLIRKYAAPVREGPPGYPRTFCNVCGGPVPDDSEEEVGIPAGTLDDDPGIRPQGHIFVEFKAPWFEITDSLPQFQRRAKR